ncbi:MAG TPA: hypothetical protein VL092_00555, partial [Chitinophagaceae bacterium]|nr:hypothetical protein [Chitinophagaceae bacterium]
RSNHCGFFMLTRRLFNRLPAIKIPLFVAFFRVRAVSVFSRITCRTCQIEAVKWYKDVPAAPACIVHSSYTQSKRGHQ